MGHAMRMGGIRVRTRVLVVTEGLLARMILDDSSCRVVRRCCSTNSTNARWMAISAWRWRSTSSRRCGPIFAPPRHVGDAGRRAGGRGCSVTQP